jgi:phage-related protein
MDPSLLGKPMNAPTTRPASPGQSRFWMIIVGLLVVALLIGGFVIFKSKDTSGVLRQQLRERQAATLLILDDGQKNISDENLAKVNSELSLIMKGDNTAIQSALKELKTKKSSKETIAAESAGDTLSRLKISKLNGVYDATYRLAITQKIDSLHALLKEIYTKTHSKSLKTAIGTEYDHLTTFLDRLNTPT